MSKGAALAAGRPLNRILMTADAVGGVWQYTVDLVHGLAAWNVQVIVATMGPLPSEEQRLQLPAEAGLVSREYSLEWQQNPWADVDEAGRWLLALAEEHRPDLVHLNGYVHASLPWRCPVLVVGHSCVVSWWRAVHGCEPAASWEPYRRRVQAGLEVCDRVVTPSQFMAEELAKLYGTPAGKIRTIWNSSSTPAPLGVDKQPFCLAAGRVWDEAKNFSVLRDVAETISWPIYLAGGGLAGGGEGSDGLRPVRVLGRIPYGELLARMSAASIFLHPALYEPFGLATLEAARAGCCLVLADTASSRELWEGAAVFANPREPSQWSEIVERLSNDAEERQRLGRAALERSQVYGTARFLASYRSVYDDLLQLCGGNEEAA